MPTTVNTPAPRELSPLFDEALAVTHEFHRSQFRKETAIPYIAHLLQVAGLVLEAEGDEEQAIAALLHDAVEDAGDPEEAAARRDRIRDRFGDRVLRLVDACTDGDPAQKEGMSWRARKDRYLKHLESADHDVLLISVADKLHNARAILRDYRRLGEPLWSRFRGGKSGTLWYYSALAATYRRAGNLPYSEELMEVMDTLQRLATRGSRRHILNWVATPDFLASLNALLEGTGAAVRAQDTWMPTGWGAPAEARLDGRGPESSLDIDWDDLRSWWLGEPGRGNVPNWDLLATCSIDGREGLVLVEAKANAAELSSAGKRPPGTSPDSRANDAAARHLLTVWQPKVSAGEPILRRGRPRRAPPRPPPLGGAQPRTPRRGRESEYAGRSGFESDRPIQPWTCPEEWGTSCTSPVVRSERIG